MIAKLKRECGYQFTQKLEGMFSDMSVSEEHMKRYLQQQREHRHGPKLAVHVLTTGYWPTQAVEQCKLPAEVEAVGDDFRQYYLRHHSGRQLEWQPALGTAELQANFGSLRATSRGGAIVCPFRAPPSVARPARARTLTCRSRCLRSRG